MPYMCIICSSYINLPSPVRQKVSPKNRCLNSTLNLSLSARCCGIRKESEMWRRVVSLSPLISMAKSRLLNQVAYGFNACQLFSTHVLNPAEDGETGARRKRFVTFVLGGPGSGKGTQCTRIVNAFGFTHLSVGDLLRKEIYSTSENGSMILNTIKEGKIVPSEVTVKLIKQAIEASQTDRILVDGFPRSEENRIAYEQIIGTEPDIVLFFDCPEEEMVKRVLSRNQGRIDDNIDTVKERLAVFAELNLPVIKHYSEKGKLYKIDGTGSEDEIFERVRPVFAALR